VEEVMANAFRQILKDLARMSDDVDVLECASGE
jgi:hypothetical protein